MWINKQCYYLTLPCLLQCNLADATQDLLSQTDAYSSVGSAVVDINVLSPTEDAKLLEVKFERFFLKTELR